MSKTDASIEMPKYKCHKEVWALKIGAISLAPRVGTEPSQWQLTFVNPGYGSVYVPIDWCDKHSAEVGGYYVVYEDGYNSFSPAGAFESGYTLIE